MGLRTDRGLFCFAFNGAMLSFEKIQGLLHPHFSKHTYTLVIMFVNASLVIQIYIINIASCDWRNWLDGWLVGLGTGLVGWILFMGFRQDNAIYQI